MGDSFCGVCGFFSLIGKGSLLIWKTIPSSLPKNKLINQITSYNKAKVSISSWLYGLMLSYKHISAPGLQWHYGPARQKCCYKAKFPTIHFQESLKTLQGLLGHVKCLSLAQIRALPWSASICKSFGELLISLIGGNLHFRAFR